MLMLNVTIKNGGGAGIRTPDSANMSRMLYQLSYAAVGKNKHYIKHHLLQARSFPSHPELSGL